MATSALIINARYQLKGKPIGQGGMGVVYKAYDTVTRRDVALKTMRGTLNPAALELFSKEWSLLARVSHPNIIDILDTGEFEQEGERKPFFVMPLLPGATLEFLIENASTRLTVDRIVGIAAQTCRGLQAAHEQGLIHRDLKPSNIFVMDDDTVKIIDFGVVHLAGMDSVKGIKGTLQYMAPEQIEMKPTSAASDIFSLGVVCYQALTGRKPFARKTEAETVDAVRRHIPPPVCELNPLVSQLVSRVIHKAMAKDPWHRFSTAREYSETLQKALNGQPIERFDREKIQPRIERAKRAQIEGDHQFASEILSELEAEGNIDPDMTVLRIQLDQAIRQKSIRQLLDSARTRLEEDEFPLALQKIQEVLGIDPLNADALSLRKQIEKQRSDKQTENWFRLVEQHLHNHAFDQARQALEEILKLNAKDNRAREMLVEVDRREQEINRLRKEKEQLYQSAVNCYQHGEVSSALSKLERVLELNRQSPDSAIPDRDAQYQSLYNQIRTEREAARNSYAEGRRHLSDRKFGKVLELCDEFLKKSPGDPMFQALKLEAEEQRRQEQSSFIAEIARRVEAEADLDRRVNILKEAAERYPEEQHFQQSLRLVRDRRDLVNSIVGKARQYEERGQFSEALSQFDILRNIYGQYPGIEFEAERLKRRRDEQVREEAKGRWVDQIDRHIAGGDYARARDLVRTAISEFPNDRELSGLERLAQQALERAAEAEEWLQRGQKLCFDRQFGDGLEALRKAASLDNRNAVIRAALLNALVEQARSVLGQDWRAAEPLIQQALGIDGGHPLAKSLQGLVLDYKRQEIVNECISQAREMQVAGDLRLALAKVEEALISYPTEVRLVQLRSTLRNLGASPAAQPVEAPKQESAPPRAVKPEQVKPEIPSQPVGGTAETEVLQEGVRQPQGDFTSPDPFSVNQSVAPPRVQNPPAPQPVEPRPIKANTDDRRGKEKTPQTHAVNPFRRVLAVLQSLAEPKRRLSPLQWGLIALAPLILFLAAIATMRNRPPAPVVKVVVREYPVDLRSNIVGATYLIDNKPVGSSPVRLPAGKYTAEARLAGYKPASQVFSITAGTAPPPVQFQLEPELIQVRLSSALTAGKVSLDGGPPADLRDGGFSDDAVSLAAEHTLTLLRPNKESLSFSFKAEPGGIVTVTQPLRARDLDAVVIANLAGRAHVYTSATNLKGGINDQPTQPIPPEGLGWTDLTDNPALTLDDGKTPRRLTIERGNVPSLTILLASDTSAANIQVHCNVPDADLIVNGKKRLTFKSGNGWTSLRPGTYTISAVKEGYQAAPEQKVDLKKGDLLTLPLFELKPIQRMASLFIEGATAGAAVWMDGHQIGSVQADGSFKSDEIIPGARSIALKKPDFEDRDLPEKTFSAGQAVRITGAEAQLIAYGSIEFHITPDGAVITYKRSDEQQTHLVENGKSVSLKAGRYTVSANAGVNRGRAEQLTVEPGKRQLISWTLPAAPVDPIKTQGPKPPTPSRPTPEYFRESASWTQNGNWWAHKGDEESWLRLNQGTFTIDILRQTSRIVKRTKHVDWIIDQRNSDNHVDYSFDFSNLERRATVDGKAGQKVKVRVPPASGDDYTIQIEIAPEQIAIKDAKGNVLDQYARPNRAAPLGRFGFKGEVALVVKHAE